MNREEAYRNRHTRSFPSHLTPFQIAMLQAADELGITMYQENRYRSAVLLQGSLDIRTLVVICVKAGINFENVKIQSSISSGIILSFQEADDK